MVNFRLKYKITNLIILETINYQKIKADTLIVVIDKALMFEVMANCQNYLEKK